MTEHADDILTPAARAPERSPPRAGLSLEAVANLSGVSRSMVSPD